MNSKKQKITFGKITLPDVKESSNVTVDNKDPKETSGFGKFGDKNDDKNRTNIDEVNDQINKVMGFTNFGQKKAKSFDVQEMVQQALENKNNIVPPKPPEELEDKETSSSEDEIGPPIPEDIKLQLQKLSPGSKDDSVFK